MLLTIQRQRARVVFVAVAVVLVVTLAQLYTSFPAAGRQGPDGPHLDADPLEPTPQPPPPLSRPTDDPADAVGPSSLAPPLPLDYLAGPPESAFCRDRYGVRYLEDTRDSAASYCAPGSRSALTCFWSSTAEGEKRTDAMCFGQHATYDAAAQRFRLGCALRNPHDAPSVPTELTRYWYNTGPGPVVGQAVSFDDDVDDVGAPSGLGDGGGAVPRRTTVLVKREGSHNPWHSLMEIMSTSWSLDVLRMTRSPGGLQQPLLGADFAATTQVLLLDDHPDGPYLDMWRLLAKLPVRRFADVGADEPASDIVVPLAGGSNPLWQGDWKDLACHDSALVTTFVARTLAHLGVSTPLPPRGADVSVTLIRRTGTRKLVDEEAHVAALRAAAIPHMRLDVVDLATLPFREQVELVRGTDLLVGVHGAGLTHLLFLQPGSAVVEVLPHGFDHKGFRNLAQMLGHGYFRTHAREGGGGSDGGKLRRRDWQSDDVRMDEEALVAIVSAAVKSLYSKSLRSFDV